MRLDGALMLLGLLLGIGALLRYLDEPKPRALDDLERDYVVFFAAEVAPMVERDKLTRFASGCDIGASDLLCVECYLPGGEVWVRCGQLGCALLNTGPELDAAGADVGICERRSLGPGPIAFTRRRP